MACTEGDRPYLMCVVPHGKPVEWKFDAATGQELFRFVSSDGQHDLVLGVRWDMPEWKTPERTKGKWERNQKMLADIFPQ
jgi:hypothetical protein